MVETKEAIGRNASVGGKIASALGFDNYKVDMDKEFNKVQIAGNIDTQDKQRFEKFLSNSTDNMTKLAQADDGVNYELVMNKQQLSRFKTEPTFKVDKNIESFTTEYLNPELTEDQRNQIASITTEFSLIDNPNDKIEVNYYTISDSLPSIPAKGESMSQRQLFQRDVDRVASIKKSIYKANAEGVEGFIQMPSDIEIVQESLNFVVDRNKLILSADPVDRLVRSDTKAEFQYNRLTTEDFTSAASERPSKIPENTSYELSEDVDELADTPTQEGRKPVFENITTSETISLAKVLSKDKDFINEPIEVIKSSYDSMLNKISKDDIVNRKIIQKELDKILQNKNSKTILAPSDIEGRMNEGIKRMSEDSFKLGEFLKEKERETAIKKSEKYLSGESSVFISSSFNKWIEQTKGIRPYTIKKEDKPELVREFLEFLQEA